MLMSGSAGARRTHTAHSLLCLARALGWWGLMPVGSGQVGSGRVRWGAVRGLVKPKRGAFRGRVGLIAGWVGSGSVSVGSDRVGLVAGWIGSGSVSVSSVWVGRRAGRVGSGRASCRSVGSGRMESDTVRGESVGPAAGPSRPTGC